MNAVWNSYGQLCGCPEIFKKSCKFFCRELDIRVAQIVKANTAKTILFQDSLESVRQVAWLPSFAHLIDENVIQILFTV